MEKILIAEDDLVTGTMMQNFLQSCSYLPVWKKNGQEALDAYRKEPVRLVFVDIDMPVMGGKELIRHLSASDPAPVIIVTTSVSGVQDIIEIMKLGVYDYIIKPVILDDLKMKIARALEAAEFRRLGRVLQEERTMKLEQQLEWFKLREKMLKGDEVKGTDNIFHYLNTSFNQGAGLGSIVPLVSMALMSAEKFENDKYRIEIDGDIYRLLEQNITMSETALERFKEIDIVMTRNMEFTSMSAMGIYAILQDVVAALTETLAIGGHRILISDPKSGFENCAFQVNPPNLEKILRELIVNACKFSRKNSAITVMVTTDPKNLYLSILNEPVPVSKGNIGIPLEFEHAVFDPFFRMSPYVYEEYKTIDFGLGLTFVEQVVFKHGGTVRLFNINDYSDLSSAATVKVNALIKLPVRDLSACIDKD